MSLQFYKLLFDDDEQTCFTSTPYGTAVYSAHGDCNINYFSINPMHTSRKDTNVTCLRNILLEFDGISEIEQLAIIKTIPYSTVVWSGNKSYHCIISLMEPCRDRNEYNDLVQRIMRKVPQADPSTKNPSRLSRCPGAFREDTGRPQRLHDLACRRTRAELEAWLGPELKTEQPKSIIEIPEGMKRIKSRNTCYFLEFGADPGHWNRELFLAALDLLRCGYDDNSTTGLLEAVTGRLDKSDRRTIQSAIDTYRRDG